MRALRYLLPALFFAAALLLASCRLFPTPVKRLDSARNLEADKREELLHQGQEYAAAAERTLAKDKAPSRESIVAADLVKRANVAFGFALGALLPDQSARIDELTANLTSTNSEIQAKGAAALAKRDSDTAKTSQELASERAKVKKLEGQVEQYAAERDAVARKWERLMRIVWLVAGSWVFVAFILPILSKAFPAVGAIATVAQGIVAPFAAAAAHKTKQVLGDVVSGVEDVREALKKAGSITKAEVDDKLSAWVTEADGTAAAVDAVRRERKLIA